jgi:hypothetical protein
MADRHAYATLDFDGAPANLAAWQSVHVAIGFIRGCTTDPQPRRRFMAPSRAPKRDRAACD